MFQEKNFSILFAAERKYFCGFSTFFKQNHQSSLVSKNSKKQTLVMQSDKRQKIVKQMLCSKKMLIFSIFVAPK